MRVWIWGLGAAVAAAGAAFAARDAIQMRLVDRSISAAMGRDVLASLEKDAIHVAMCGTGSPLPSRDRTGACTAVIANGRIFVFDSGEGSGETLAAMGMPLGQVEAVFLTHLHSDHFEGLGALMIQRWAGTSAPTPLKVWGPDGVSEVTEGLNRAYRIDSGYRIAHHGTAVVPPAGFGLAGTAIAPGLVYDANGVRIAAFPVAHAPVDPAFGYRITFRGLSVTISGDTGPSQSLEANGKGSDLLVHEVLSARIVNRMEDAARRAGQPNRAKIFADIPGYHTSPEQAADAATRTGAKALVLTHVVPALPTMLDGLITRPASKRFSGPIWLARDGDLISVSTAGARKADNLID